MHCIGQDFPGKFGSTSQPPDFSSGRETACSIIQSQRSPRRSLDKALARTLVVLQTTEEYTKVTTGIPGRTEKQRTELKSESE